MRSPLVIALATFIYPLSASSILVNRTIDDSDLNEIVYVPATSWQLLDNSSCSECLNPNVNLTLQQTAHYGLHVAPSPSTNNSLAKRDRDHDSDDDGGGHDVSGTPSMTGPAPASNTDGPTFQDVTVMASLNFTGSAFYIYCVLPMQNNTVILSKTNLTFLLDGFRVGSFVHDPQAGSGSTPDFQYTFLVFFKTGLSQAQHTLDIKPELGSAVLLDYIQYSHESDDSTSSTTGATPSGSLTQSNGGKGGSGDDNGGSKKNTVTFGVAIGCTVGVLALVAVGVFISLYRRRRRSARLQKRLDAQEAAVRPASPEMRGPEPFIPRYFPGTAVQPVRHSPPPSPSLFGRDGIEELGPSHGLDLPPAPGHSGVSEITSPVISARRNTAAVPHDSPPSALTDAEDSPPPQYQEAVRSLLVSIPLTYPPPPRPPPPGLLYPYSPSSPHSPQYEGDSPTSTTGLRISPRHSNDNSPRPNEPPIPTTDNQRSP